jgi:hypothetical protein
MENHWHKLRLRGVCNNFDSFLHRIHTPTKHAIMGHPLRNVTSHITHHKVTELGSVKLQPTSRSQGSSAVGRTCTTLKAFCLAYAPPTKHAIIPHHAYNTPDAHIPYSNVRQLALSPPICNQISHKSNQPQQQTRVSLDTGNLPGQQRNLLHTGASSIHTSHPPVTAGAVMQSLTCQSDL